VAEVVPFDVEDEASVRRALEGVDTAFYLVHTLGAGADYARRDREAATLFATCAAATGVARIVYLGGLGADSEGRLSDHLASRHEVGRLLAEHGVPVVEFRASIVIGSGSTSFEMIRNLVEKIPVMTTPKWVRMASQPIAISDVEAYLLAGALLPLAEDDGHRIYEIGGADVIGYGDLLRMYAKRKGLKRLVLPVPVLSPGLSGWWLYLFTPREATVGRQLAESLRFPTVVRDPAASRDFPDIHTRGAEEALERALAEEDERFAKCLWAEEFGDVTGATQRYREGRHIDSRVIRTSCPPEAAFDPIVCIGGENGWYAFDTLWDLRGFVDLVLGGPGRRRGRRDRFELVEGDYLDWWRVETVKAPTLLRLRAEMKMPGSGWLQYELTREPEGTLVRQTAIFEPRGLLGRVYWYGVLPFHHFVFNGTLAGIDAACRELISGPNTCPLPGAYARAVARREGGESGAL
jgi:uncharacterized protein YbjT (DUF2867 family)